MPDCAKPSLSAIVESLHNAAAVMLYSIREINVPLRRRTTRAIGNALVRQTIYVGLRQKRAGAQDCRKCRRTWSESRRHVDETSSVAYAAAHSTPLTVCRAQDRVELIADWVILTFLWRATAKSSLERQVLPIQANLWEDAEDTMPCAVTGQSSSSTSQRPG